MATIKYFDYFGPIPNFGGAYELTVNEARSQAVYLFESGATVVLFGDHLKIKNGELAFGTVDAVRFFSEIQETALYATGLNSKAFKFGLGAIDNGAGGIHDRLFSGDDRILGSSEGESLVGGRGDDKISGGLGEDSIFGGRGDDILRGGYNRDMFAFIYTRLAEHDVVRDFDPLEDDIYFTNTEVTKVRSLHGGDDTLLILSGHSTVLLEDVTKAEWLAYASQP